MGAFDGYKIYGHSSHPDTVRKTYEYFKTQTAFSFFKGFGVDELTKLLVEAETNKNDTVYIPQEKPGSGHIGLSTWYVRALVNAHLGKRA